tara:strand:+ start:2259 stop:2363 length:105 start_codon:yes stop_codon:yes gene_type:complete
MRVSMDWYDLSFFGVVLMPVGVALHLALVRDISE